MQVSPSIGSSGGTLVTVSGVGFGLDQNKDSGVNLYHVQSDTNLCSTVEVTDYGTFTCQTIATEISDTDELKLVIESTKYECTNTASPSDCNLSQIKASSPVLTSVALSGSSEIIFQGTNFLSSS